MLKMIRLATLIMAALAVAVTGLQVPIPGYTVEDIVWSVEPWNNGTVLNITGPVQHVYEVLKEINPDLVKNVPTSDPGSPNLAELDARCGALTWGWQAANYNRIREGAEYLKTVQGRPANGPGPGACGRVSCSWNSAIWWCNDKNVENVLPGFSTIADCGWTLCQDCVENPSGKSGDYWCRGQNFMPGDWNCIVRWDGDSC